MRRTSMLAISMGLLGPILVLTETANATVWPGGGRSDICEAWRLKQVTIYDPTNCMRRPQAWHQPRGRGAMPAETLARGGFTDN